MSFYIPIRIVNEIPGILSISWLDRIFVYISRALRAARTLRLGVLSNNRIERVVFFFNNRTSWPLANGWKEEVEARGKCRPIHRYNRIERFKNTLDQLLGCRGEISDHVMSLMDVPCTWESIRQVLKRHKLPKLYNQIPLIIRKLGGGNCIEFQNFNAAYVGMLKEFAKIHYTFNLKRGDEKKYFPNLRFVALVLVERWGGKFNIEIPFIRTKRKLRVLYEIINKCS